MHWINRRTPLVAACLLAFLVAGCAIDTSHGTPVSQAQAEAFVVGTSMRDEVIAALGKPYTTAALPNGGTRIIYSASRGRINPPSFATLTGQAPVSEVTGGEATLFDFDASGRLTRIFRRVWPDSPSAAPGG